MNTIAVPSGRLTFFEYWYNRIAVLLNGGPVVTIDRRDDDSRELARAHRLRIGLPDFSPVMGDENIFHARVEWTDEFDTHHVAECARVIVLRADCVIYPSTNSREFFLCRLGTPGFTINGK